MTIFVSVDVETNSTSVFTGELLTVGAVAVIDGEITDDFYLRVEYDKNHYDEETMRWWGDQNDKAFEEAFEGVRHSRIAVADDFHDFVSDLGDEPKFFVANPVVFDWPWIDKLFSDTKVANPFHYRSMCLRSVHFGMGGEWGKSREGHEPTVPHHALFDAYAQARDLQDILKSLGQK